MRVTNTAPLIFLAKLGRLSQLRAGAEFVFAPPAVLAEVRAKDDDARNAIEQTLGDWLIERGPTRLDLVNTLSLRVDAGEAEVLALALEAQIPSVVLDDLVARRIARRLGLTPIGTPGLLLAAKERGELTAIAPEIARLEDAGFRASPALIATVLKAAGETPS